MRVRFGRIAGPCLLAAALSLYASPARAELPEFAGGDDMLWAYRLLEATTENPRRVVFAYATPGAFAPRFRTLEPFRVAGRIVEVAVRGRNLHLFFEDGTHYRIEAPRRPGREQRPRKYDAPEIKLPDGKPPLDVCGDDSANLLWAIIPGDAAALLADAASPSPSPEPDGAAGEAPPASWTTRPAEDPGPSPEASPSPAADTPDGADPVTTRPEEPAAPFVLVRYTGTRWESVAPAPDGYQDRVFSRLGADEGRVHLFLATSGKPEQVIHTVFAEGAWTSPEPVPEVSPREVLGAFIRTDTVALILGPETGGDQDRALRAMIRAEEGWKLGAGFQRSDGSALIVKTGEVAVARLSEAVAVCLTEKAGLEARSADVRVGVWPLAGGAPVHEPRRIVDLKQAPRPMADESTRVIVAAVVLTALLLVVFIRRRESFITDMSPPAGYVLAGLGRRFVAFMIDLFIVLLMAYPALVMPWIRSKQLDPDGDWQAELEIVVSQNADEVFWWLWLAAAGLFILYGILFEAVLTATPGKLFMGLRVCSGEARRCTLRQVVVRNVLRFELYPGFAFGPIAVLVALTRNRQRLGDLVARTVVIQRAAEG